MLVVQCNGDDAAAVTAIILDLGCVVEEKKLLVFKHLPNRTLGSMLNENTNVLDWPTRLRIGLDDLRGLRIKVCSIITMNFPYHLGNKNSLFPF